MAYALRILFFVFILNGANEKLFAQDSDDGGEKRNLGSVNGSIQFDAQYYLKDSSIRAPVVNEKSLMNAYGNITYRYGEHFTAGVRYEAYLNAVQGYPSGYSDFKDRESISKSGIANRFATYRRKGLQVTLGNFYEQFGSGIALRSYWEPFLGVDNSIDGISIKANPVRGVYLKGVWGRQRRYFDLGSGIVRGADLELDVTEILDSLWKSPARLRIGGSFSSRYQPDPNKLDEFPIPENVAVIAGRIFFSYKGFNFTGEYAQKANDPSDVNKTLYAYSTNLNYPGIYRPGRSAFVSFAYSQKGFGFSLNAKRLDNSDFRSDRNAAGFELPLSFLPPIARQHTYRMPSLYLYFTQPNGEMGIQGDVVYNIKSIGLNIMANYARIHDTKRTPRPEGDFYGYDSDFFAVSSTVFYEDFNLALQKKWTSKIKSNVEFVHFKFKKSLISQMRPSWVHLTDDYVIANGLVADVTYKFNKNHSLRTEAEFLVTDNKQDFGNWAMLMLEYTFAPNWFFVLADEYNYGNNDAAYRLHYYSYNMGFVKDGIRVSAGYGRQRAGMLCIGGLCRPVPAMNGFSISISATF